MEYTMQRLSAVALSLHAKTAELIVRIVHPCCSTGQRLRCGHLLDIWYTQAGKKNSDHRRRKVRPQR